MWIPQYEPITLRFVARFDIAIWWGTGPMNTHVMLFASSHVLPKTPDRKNSCFARFRSEFREMPTRMLARGLLLRYAGFEGVQLGGRNILGAEEERLWHDCEVYRRISQSQRRHRGGSRASAVFNCQLQRSAYRQCDSASTLQSDLLRR